jgi:hypothetical protein
MNGLVNAGRPGGNNARDSLRCQLSLGTSDTYRWENRDRCLGRISRVTSTAGDHSGAWPDLLWLHKVWRWKGNASRTEPSQSNECGRRPNGPLGVSLQEASGAGRSEYEVVDESPHDFPDHRHDPGGRTDLIRPRAALFAMPPDLAATAFPRAVPLLRTCHVSSFRHVLARMGPR